ncbi:MAG: serine hydrolase [Ferruginibacter sp.]|nr:serine hydrolase [Cytophagales bacterium]
MKRRIVFSAGLIAAALSGCQDDAVEVVVPPLPAANLALLADYHQGTGGKSLYITQDGEVILEQYAAENSASQPQLLASGTKSFNGIVAAAAVTDGLIAFDDLASTYLTEWKTDPRKSRITLRQMLSQTDGQLSGEAGSATNMESWADILAEPTSYEPGQRFEYGPYHFNAFAAALQRKLLSNGTETYEAYLKRRILDPLGIGVQWIYRCADQNPQVAGGAAMTAKDWAIFGEFVRNRGLWNGQQLIRPELIDECVQPTVPQNPAYGLSWWLKEPVSDEIANQNATVKELQALANATWAPEDLFLAAGAGKQRLYIIPSKKLVVVRQAALGAPSRAFTDEDFVSLLLRGKKAAE